MAETTSSPVTGGTGLLTGLRITAIVLSLGVVLQAWLGTSGLFQNEPGRIDVHGMIGNFLFLATVVQAGIALVAMQRGLPTRTILYLAVGIVLLMTAQIGLGYSTRNGENFSSAVSMHIPLGVALMGLTTVVAVLAFQIRPKDV